MSHWRPWGFGNPYMLPKGQRPREQDHGMIFEAGASAAIEALLRTSPKVMVGFAGEEQVEIKIPGMRLVAIPDEATQ